MDILFLFSSLIVLPFWLMMIVAPKWQLTRTIMHSPLVVAIPALLYAVLVIPNIGQIIPLFANPTLVGIAPLLGTPLGATIAWVHLLTFDLFVGRRIYLDSRERQVNVWLAGIVLFLTFMLGPIGYLSYLVARRGTRPAAESIDKLELSRFEAHNYVKYREQPK
ncbi:MAG: ABA4-like family protein [Chloroflexota bacterium]